MTRRGQLLNVVLWMTGALLCFSVMAVSFRELAGTLSIVELLAVRSGLGLLICAGVIALRPELRLTVNARRFWLHLVRNTIHLGSQYLWTASLLLLPLATVFALEFTMPAWTILLAALMLGERLTASRVGAVILGLLGVIVILRPGLETFRPAALLVLAAAFGYATQLIATKKLTATESTFAIVFWMNVIQLPLALAGADPAFVAKIGLADVPAALGIGVAGIAAHYCMSNALRAGDASLVVPLDFLRIPLIAIVGWWVYAEPLDLFVFAGAGLIIAGVLWNLQSEARRPLAVGTRSAVSTGGSAGSTRT